MSNEESHGQPVAEQMVEGGRPGPAPGPPTPPFPSQAYLGQIEAFAFNFAPAGWLPCDGRMLQVMTNQALFSLLGTTYGGDGRTTFGLPRLAPLGPNGPHYFISLAGAFPPRS
ncbi:MAG: Tail Collar domain protein [Xanthobacteraceae bacterium]|nr:Tail Collar domain protein [Xanthobacteraceae bacterium]